MTLREILEQSNEELIFAEGFDDAIVGVFQCYGRPDVVAYDYEECVDILMKRDGMSKEDADEYMQFNVVCASVGEHTPGFIWMYNAETKSQKPQTILDLYKKKGD